MGATLSLFVSHSSKENAFGLTLVEHLQKRLEAGGQKSIIWYDITPLHPGASWPQKMSEALTDCTVFLLILSPDAMNEEWTYKECCIALACNKPIIPILRHECHRWPLVKHIQSIDFSDPNAFQTQIATLHKAVLDVTGQSSQLLPAGRPPQQPLGGDEYSPQENLMRQMLEMIEQSFSRQSWDEIILSTNMLMTTFGQTIPSISYYLRGMTFLRQDKLQEADEAFSLALSTVADDRDLRLKCLKERINTLRAMGGHTQDVLLLAQEALRLDPQNLDWMEIEKQAREEAEIQKQSRPLVSPPPIPLPAPKPFSIAWLTFKGHRATICDLAWSPDRHYLASAGADSKVYIWEIKKAEDDPVEQHPSCIYEGHRRTVNAIDWSPDELLLASGSRDKTVQIWRINQERPVFPPQKHGDWVNDVAWSPDGSLIASACNDRKVRIWNTKTQTAHEEIFSHTSEVHCVGWSPDGKYLAAGCLDGRISIWNVFDKKQINILKGSRACIYDLVWMPDGQCLAAASADKTVRIWHHVTAELPSFMSSRPAETTANFIEYQQDHPVFALTRSRRGRRIASTDGHLVRVWYTATQSQIFTNPVHHGRVWAVAWAPDNKHIASAGSDKLIQVWSIVEDQDTLP